MIVDLTFKNFRSVKDEQVLSLEANSSQLKTHNTFAPLPDNKKLKLVKSAAMYGSNASGKSNLIRLMWTMRNFVLKSTELKAGDKIPSKYYDPFLLDTVSRNEPIEFKIDFIAFNKKKHRYIVKFNGDEIIHEYLGLYNSSHISKIFERKDSNEFVEFGEGMSNKKEEKRIAKNNLYLSTFSNTTNEQMKEIYLYFKLMEIWNVIYTQHTSELNRKIQEIFNKPENELFRKRLSKLISVADTKINSVEVAEKDDEDFAALPEEVRDNVIKRYKYETFGVHPIFENNSQVSEARLSFNDQESQGTRMMFAIGGLILEAFERPVPSVIFLDEFDNSLHPDLAKFLIELFHNPKVNRNNSQLIFATHETTLLDKKIFRKDQIWFGEKNKFGVTEFYSVKDFKDLKNLRSDIPFDKWYRTGKFGAVPNIRKFEFIAEYE